MGNLDLMHGVNGRGTWIASKLALPHLKKQKNPHILTLSPPLSLKAKWFSPHVVRAIFNLCSDLRFFFFLWAYFDLK